MLLKELFIFTNGKPAKPSSIGCFPIYGSTGIIGSSSQKLCCGEKILIARVGANCGYIQYVSGSYWVTDNTIIASTTDKIIPKYGYYLLSTIKINTLKIGAAQPLLTIGILNSIDVNIHPLEQQQHIVNIISILLLKSL